VILIGSFSLSLNSKVNIPLEKLPVVINVFVSVDKFAILFVTKELIALIVASLLRSESEILSVGILSNASSEILIKVLVFSFSTV
jgi:hypothetical protein